MLKSVMLIKKSVYY